MKRVTVSILVLLTACQIASAAKAAVPKSKSKVAKKTQATKINPKDGSVMITIPAGKFIMGSNDGRPDEAPSHTVYLDTYEIAKCEVTVAQYRKFCQATGRVMPSGPVWGWNDNYPMVIVAWEDAQAYCTWAGGRLPTEAEWEKASRGTDGRKYPWGNSWDKSKCATLDLDLKSPSPVGTYAAGASPYGCEDMAGNVWEWCADWYGKDYYKASPSRNPKGPASGEERVVRGGSWDNPGSLSRCAFRNSYKGPGSYAELLGFRLAR